MKLSLWLRKCEYHHGKWLFFKENKLFSLPQQWIQRKYLFSFFKKSVGWFEERKTWIFLFWFNKVLHVKTKVWTELFLTSFDWKNGKIDYSTLLKGAKQSLQFKEKTRKLWDSLNGTSGNLHHNQIFSFPSLLRFAKS